MISKRMARVLEEIQQVKITPKRDLSLKWLGIRLFKDVEAEVPKWLADILAEEGFAEVEEVNWRIISEKLYKEKVSLMPLELPPYTYPLIREILERSPEDSLIRRDAISLVNKRISKILNHIRTSIALTSKRTPKNLLPEELILYNALRAVVDGWMSAFLGVRDDE
ncbi:MAG: hypothetical protein QI197_03820 [Candidatus Korarchaeota archaeon]|nr:hypothetical protein [Candidatus Korarchaeota archaeon]